jgi:hypothetical protein
VNRHAKLCARLEDLGRGQLRRGASGAIPEAHCHLEVVMRKAWYLYALVGLSACGSGGHNQPVVDADTGAGGDAGVGDDAGDISDAGDTGSTTDAGVARCSRITFSTVSPPSYATGLGPRALAVKDVNRDGKPDLVVANGDGDTISVLLGSGDGTFKPRNDVATGLGPIAVAVVDVSRDGNPDVIVADLGGRAVGVLIGNGNGTFKPKVDVTTNALPAALAVADVDGDGKLDIVVANSGSDIEGAASVLIGNGNGTFKPKVDFATGGFPGAIAVADVNKDGKLDIVVASGSDSVVSVLLGNGNGMFQDKVDYALGFAAVAVAIAVVDVNRDGKLDIVAADNMTNRAFVLLNKGDGTFQDAVGYLVGERPQALAVADVTGDGKLDVVTADSNDHAMSVLAGNGDGTFQAKVDSPVGTTPAALAVADLNGDGVPDVVVADQDLALVIVLLAQCLP